MAGVVTDRDPYRLSPESIEAPPRTFLSVYKRIGPGLVLTATVVGSGELVLTTVLGAESGYRLLWLILLSCIIKVVVHNELGRLAIGTGRTTLEGFNQVPGPRIGVSWMVWLWFAVVVLSFFSVGGMLGGIAEILHRLIPAVSPAAWVAVVVSITIVLLMGGRYQLVERVAVVLVVVFTLLTIGCALLLLYRPEYFSWNRVAEGLTFQLPDGGFATAVAVFGGTGVGALELIMYPYWCIEKGYARFAGPWESTPAWGQRARGWIRVMEMDVWNSWLIYTVATIAFYFLGAGVLGGLGIVPRGADMILTLSNMFTEVLGPWSFGLFMVGALAVLYSTIFGGAAASSRTVADFVSVLGLYDRANYRTRLLAIRVYVLAHFLLPCLFLYYFREPVLMVKIGGITQALLLPIIGFATLYLRYTSLPKEIEPQPWVTFALGTASFVMLVMMGYYVLVQIKF